MISTLLGYSSVAHSCVKSKNVVLNVVPKFSFVNSYYYKIEFYKHRYTT